MGDASQAVAGGVEVREGWKRIENGKEVDVEAVCEAIKPLGMVPTGLAARQIFQEPPLDTHMPGEAAERLLGA